MSRKFSTVNLFVSRTCVLKFMPLLVWWQLNSPFSLITYHFLFRRITAACHQECQGASHGRSRWGWSCDPRLRLRLREHVETRISGQVVLRGRQSGVSVDPGTKPFSRRAGWEVRRSHLQGQRWSLHWVSGDETEQTGDRSHRWLHVRDINFRGREVGKRLHDRLWWAAPRINSWRIFGIPQLSTIFNYAVNHGTSPLSVCALVSFVFNPIYI